MGFELRYKYSQMREFLLVSILVGMTLCLLQSLSIFERFDGLLLSLNQSGYDELPTFIMVLVILFHTFLPGLMILEGGVAKGIAYTVVIWFFYGVLIHTYESGFALYVPLLAPLIGCVVSIIRVLAWEYTCLTEEKDGIRKTLGSFVEPRVAEYVLNNPDIYNQNGQRTMATVMFADLRGFTKICEQLDPEQVIAILRDCFSKLISIAKTNGGTVDKLIGDCMMVVWGNPVPMENHAEKAVEAAIEMQTMMQSLQRKWRDRLGVDIVMGIGIATDEVVAGTVGSEEFCDYTVLGSGVNLAAGLEAACPGSTIYVSENTHHLLANTFSFVKTGNVRVKNSGGSATAYQVLTWSQDYNTDSETEQMSQGLSGAELLAN